MFNKQKTLVINGDKVEVSQEYLVCHRPWGYSIGQHHDFYVHVLKTGTIASISKWKKNHFTIKGDYADIYDARSKMDAIRIAIAFLEGKFDKIERYKRNWSRPSNKKFIVPRWRD